MNTSLVIIIIIWIFKIFPINFLCSAILHESWADSMLHNIHICSSKAPSPHWPCKIRTDLNFNDCLRKKKVSSCWTECASNRDTFSELNGLCVRYLHGIFSGFLFYLLVFRRWRRHYRMKNEDIIIIPKNRSRFSTSYWLRIMLILLRLCRLKSILFRNWIPNLW